jgi:hypothetical protein
MRMDLGAVLARMALAKQRTEDFVNAVVKQEVVCGGFGAAFWTARQGAKTQRGSHGLGEEFAEGSVVDFGLVAFVEGDFHGDDCVELGPG